MTRCKTCDEWVYDSEGGRHKCLPAWLIWRPEHDQAEEDVRPTYAKHITDAVEKWAEEDDAHSADYSIVGGAAATVTVKDTAGNVTTWTVSGEAVPSYTARMVRVEVKAGRVK